MKSAVMKRAWKIYKETGCKTRYEFGLALEMAWYQVRREAAAPIKYVIDGVTYFHQKEAFKAAFLSKYPTGSIEIGQFWNSAKVRFEAGGKQYFLWSHGLGAKTGNRRK